MQDEARVGQQGTLTRVWAERGSRPVRLKDCRRASAWIFGAVCPDKGLAAGLVMPAVNIDAMNRHLELIGQTAGAGAHVALLLDGVGWHQPGGTLKVPDNMTLIPIPPYSPELNPLENIWAYLRSNKLSHQVWNTYEQIVDACCEAWNFIVDDGARMKSIAHREWMEVKI
jgi:DDE superfamily endonuclease